MKKGAEGQRSVLKEVADATRFVASLGLMVGGGYAGWVAPGETSLSVECKNLKTQVENLQNELINKGTLGRGDYNVSGLEIRNPDDMGSIRIWGNLKNQRDKVCGEYHQQRDNSLAPFLGRIGAAVGALSLFLYLSPKRR